uniref:WD repeat-containing protein 76 n=1 Tax=Corethron hystrix TaxID=216773 RepID=A0A7S1B7W6_9STRA|mmetsp:Transcript_16258/g.36570  ORF Transcript_16258/g.36570 Transcript_16258/m.36570 type:complete len:606 (+) Transcript_16258:99-1916(+)
MRTRNGTKRNFSILEPTVKKSENDDDSSIETTASPAPALDSSLSPADVGEDDSYISTFTRGHATYSEMVAAKRQRVAEMMVKSGLLAAVAGVRNAAAADKTRRATASSHGGIVARKSKKTTMVPPRRKSGRIAGEKAQGLQVEREMAGGKVVVSGTIGEKLNTVDVRPSFHSNRVNDGSPLSLVDAMGHVDERFVKDEKEKIVACESFWDKVIPSAKDMMKSEDDTVSHGFPLLNVNSGMTAKITPDRIYAIATHPSPHNLVVAAGDKSGHVGIWRVTDDDDDDDLGPVSLFRPHSGCVNHVAFSPDGSSMTTISYDGSVRLQNLTRGEGSFEEIFASYPSLDNNIVGADMYGYGLDTGYKYWTQYGCYTDSSSNSLLLSTSIGTVMHIDLRSGKGRTRLKKVRDRGFEAGGSPFNVTFNVEMSSKKINTLSLHPNKTTLATAGLDTTVKIWDIRKVDTRKNPKPLAVQQCGRSVNSAFFSPSGSQLLATTMSNSLTLSKDVNLLPISSSIKPQINIRHDNQTGRWLTTFMAQWHPTNDIFVVGSMKRPRMIEIFGSDGKSMQDLVGDGLTAVASRCCFRGNARGAREAVVGGNASGRVSVFRDM